MRYSLIRDMDISNGVGIACSIFFQGCRHHCKGCFNKETWDFNGGKEFTKEVQDKFIELCNKPFIDCVSILGGEPLQQDDTIGFYKFTENLKIKVRKPIYLWTGYTWEEIMQSRELTKKILCVDYLIDGKFEEDKKDLNLKLRGSSNQRIIDVIASLESGNIVTIE